MSLFPAWFPADALLLGALAFAVAILVMNRGDRWFINIKAQDEPLVVAGGVFLVALALSGRLGVSQTANDLLVVAGVLTSTVGVYVWRSDDYDISNLI